MCTAGQTNRSTDHGIPIIGCFRSFSCWRSVRLKPVTFGINTPVNIFKDCVNMLFGRTARSNCSEIQRFPLSYLPSVRLHFDRKNVASLFFLNCYWPFFIQRFLFKKYQKQELNSQSHSIVFCEDFHVDYFLLILFEFLSTLFVGGFCGSCSFSCRFMHRVFWMLGRIQFIFWFHRPFLFWILNIQNLLKLLIWLKLLTLISFFAAMFSYFSISFLNLSIFFLISQNLWSNFFDFEFFLWKFFNGLLGFFLQGIHLF